MKYLLDIIYLFFPNPCICCNEKLGSREKYICTKCFLDLPYTKEHVSPQQAESNKLFWGKIPVAQVYTAFYFIKGNKIQKLLHELKYNNQPNLGIYMGGIMGKEIIKYNQPLPEVMIPVPLHPKRLKTRGYNQSESLAKGIHNILKIPIDVKSIVRNQHNTSQTKQKRFTRWENVSDIFEIKNPEKIKGKHILIIDDVITTGSTLEALCDSILKQVECTISIATFAVTKNK